MNMNETYATPEVEIIETMPEGVLCGSIDMEPEEGYM